MREAYGYSDEYILGKTPEWLNDTLERILKGKHEALKMDGAMHGLTLDDSEFVEEVKDASDDDLKEAGLSLG